MNSEFNQYLSFLTDTLGLESIVLDVAENASTTKNDTIKYFIQVENLSAYSAEETSLLKKMVGALQLEPAQYAVFEFGENKLTESSAFVYKIILRDQPKEKGETFSPRILLKNPERKRKAWDDLKLAFDIKPT